MKDNRNKKKKKKTKTKRHGLSSGVVAIAMYEWSRHSSSFANGTKLSFFAAKYPTTYSKMQLARSDSGERIIHSQTFTLLSTNSSQSDLNITPDIFDLAIPDSDTGAHDTELKSKAKFAERSAGFTTETSARETRCGLAYSDQRRSLHNGVVGIFLVPRSVREDEGMNMVGRGYE